MFTRVEKHCLPLENLTWRLERAGTRVERMSPLMGYDLLVNGNVRLAVRVAFLQEHNHNVTVKGQRRTYRYEFAHFNFHHHGKIGKQYADYVICVVMDDTRLGVTLAEYVLPWEVIDVKTFWVKRAYRGRFAMYRDHWEGVAPIERVA